jgi:hypothetical protein
VIDDESLVITRTNTCLSYASAMPSYSVPELLHHLNYARVVSDFILIYLTFLLWYVK